MIDFFLNIITHPAFGTVTFLAGFLLGDHFSIRRDHRQRFNKAAAEFRDSFTDTIRELEGMGVNDIHLSDILANHYVSHVNALIRFKSVLSERQCTEIQKAWNYHCWDNAAGTPNKFFAVFEHYSQHDDSAVLALQNIHKILYLAKYR